MRDNATKIGSRPSAAVFEQSETLRGLIAASISDAVNSRLVGLAAFGTPSTSIKRFRDIFGESGGVPLSVFNVVVIDIEIGIYLQFRNVSAKAPSDNIAALAAVRFFLGHASGGDLLGAFLASQTAQVCLLTWWL